MLRHSPCLTAWPTGEKTRTPHPGTRGRAASADPSAVHTTPVVLFPSSAGRPKPPIAAQLHVGSFVLHIGKRTLCPWGVVGGSKRGCIANVAAPNRTNNNLLGCVTFIHYTTTIVYRSERSGQRSFAKLPARVGSSPGPLETRCRIRNGGHSRVPSLSRVSPRRVPGCVTSLPLRDK